MSDDLMLSAALAVMREKAAGRNVDPSRLAWAEEVLKQINFKPTPAQVQTYVSTKQ